MSITNDKISIAASKAAKLSPAATRFKFRITLEGVILLIVIMLVGFAAWHSGTNLLYLIFSILIALYLVHGFMMSVNLSSLQQEEIVPETVVAGQPFDVGVRLTNSKRLAPTSAITLFHTLDNNRKKLGSAYFATIPPQESRESYYSAVIHRRGLYRLTTGVISTRYPFGFEERMQLRQVNSDILVLPPTYSVAALAANLPFGFGDQDSTVRGTGTELYGLREYVPGEHARHVHWRTSARAQKVMVAEFTRDERRQVILFLNNTIMSELRDTKIEKSFENAIILTASVARHLINAGFEVGLVTSDTTLPVGQGSTHLLSLLRHLAVIELESLRPVHVAGESVLQITYHKYRETPETAGNVLKIDSTQWRPPVEENLQGEKRP